MRLRRSRSSFGSCAVPSADSPSTIRPPGGTGSTDPISLRSSSRATFCSNSCGVPEFTAWAKGRWPANLLARSDLAALALELLGDHEVLFDFHSRPEARELLKAAWQGLDVETKARLLKSIDGGPDPTPIALDPVAEAEKASTETTGALLCSSRWTVNSAPTISYG